MLSSTLDLDCKKLMKFQGGFGNACKTFTASHHPETTNVESIQNSGKVLLILKKRREINYTAPCFNAHYRIKVDQNVNLTRWESEVSHEELCASISSLSLQFISSSHAISMTNLISLSV